MRESFLACVVAIAWGVGCGSVQSDVDASAAGDDAAPAIDARPSTHDAVPDAATLPGSVACGLEGGMCTTPDEYCCDDGSGATCMASPPAGCATAYRCDGPEDCGGGGVCCFATGSQCEAADTCADTGGARMCHSPADCLTGENCCDTNPGPISGGGYGACRAGACPQ